MKLKNFILASLSLLSIAPVYAQTESDIKLKFDFENVNGTSVTDATGAGVTAKLMSTAKVEKMGTYSVLNLGSGAGYLDMTSSAGEIMKSHDDYAISVYYRVDESASLSGNGYFLWAFSTSTACTANAGKYSAYRLNAQRYATSTGGYSNETGIEVGSASATGLWKHVVYTENSGKGSLYIDGKLISTVNNMPKNSTNYGTSTINYCWIGRPPFSGDAYLSKTLVADFRIYGRALSAEEISMLAGKTADLDYQYAHGSVGDKTKLLEAIASAESLLAGDTSNYPSGAVTELEDVLNYVKDLSAGDLSQNVIVKYTNQLTKAISAFNSTKGKVFDTSVVSEGYNIDRGFKHPGGLHTQEDFERIRQQLAEGNETVTAAYNVLKTAEYAQPSTATWPVETIVRGGSTGQNYINAARGAAIAYQNALRWQIEGNKNCAKHAVDVLMAWARVNKVVGGDTNQSLAAGLYGYEFAQAAELVRDYEGWSEEDFNEFKSYMLNIWYPRCIDFLRRRHGTWENSANPGAGGQRPGHYWSNWGLCNVLALLNIGILCDDVYIYNQGLSYFKYDQVGTFVDPRTVNPIRNDGLTEFLGNLVVTTSESSLEKGAYGKLGQMQESGRDLGHAVMALGLAVDIAKVGWNQGDDIFSYMDNRLAAGIEYIAASNQLSSGLPWTNYAYADCRTALHNAWVQGGPAYGNQIRPYWGTVIGHYEGIKGVKMPYSEKCLSQLGIDGGGLGSVSGGYDHLGYSVLMNTRPFATEQTKPTLLTPKMEYNGKIYEHNELGGLKNTFQTDLNTCMAKGQTVKLMPQLPEGATDTGNWKWNTGETTKDITVSTDKSFVYRATYTNENGVESEQVFTIAVDGDCNSSLVYGNIYANGEYMGDTEAEVFYGSTVTLNVWNSSGWGAGLWDNGQTGGSCTLSAVTRDRDVSVIFTNQGGRKSILTFHIKVRTMQPNIDVNNVTNENVTEVIVNSGDNVTLSPYVATALSGGNYEWSDGSSEKTLSLGSVEKTGIYTLHYTLGDIIDETMTFRVFVTETDSKVMVNPDNYLIRHVATDTYLTNNGDSTVSLKPLNEADNSQKWCITRANSARYDIISLADSLYIKSTGELVERTYRTQRIALAKGSNYCLFFNSSNMYWTVDAATLDINFEGSDQLYSYPFELIPVEYDPTAIKSVSSNSIDNSNDVYNLQGQVVRRNAQNLDGLTPGIYIINKRKVLIK